MNSLRHRFAMNRFIFIPLVWLVFLWLRFNFHSSALFRSYASFTLYFILPICFSCFDIYIYIFVAFFAWLINFCPDIRRANAHFYRCFITLGCSICHSIVNWVNNFEQHTCRCILTSFCLRYCCFHFISVRFSYITSNV